MSQNAVPRVEHAALVRGFDYVAAGAFGAAASVLAAWIVPDTLHLLVEMALGMAVGMVAILPLLAFFSWLLGGFEIVVLSFQAGMVAGMVGAMTTSTAVEDIAFEGLLVGLLVQLLIHAVDRSVGGEVSRDG